MKRWAIVAIAGLAFYGLALGTPPEGAGKPDRECPAAGSEIPGRVLVKVKDKGKAHGLVRDIRGKIRKEYKLKGIERWISVELPEGADTKAAIDAIKQDSRVELAEPVQVYTVDQTVPPPPSNDPLWGAYPYNNLYHVSKIQAPEAWQVATGAGVIVGVIDTGCDLQHEDLVANLWSDPLTGQHGIDANNNDNDPDDDQGHGTHVAGIIAGTANNALGVVGVAPGARLQCNKAGNCCGGLAGDNIIEAIEYAVAHGAKVLNNSYGGGGFGQAFFDVIQAALDAGVVFVVSSGNSGRDMDTSGLLAYPCAYVPLTPDRTRPSKGLICVNSSRVTCTSPDPNSCIDGISGFSNWGAVSTDIWAPGESVNSTCNPTSCSYFGPGPLYCQKSGTSMASPDAAGVVALVMSAHPDWTPDQVGAQILATVDPVPVMAGTCNAGGICGRINAYRAVGGSVRAPTTATITGDVPDPSEPGAPVLVTATLSGGTSLPTGSLEVTLGGSACQGAIADGRAACTVTSPATGSYQVNASYIGDVAHMPASDTEAHQVNPPPPSTECGNRLCEGDERWDTCGDCPYKRTGKPTLRYWCGDGTRQLAETPTVCRTPDGNF